MRIFLLIILLLSPASYMFAQNGNNYLEVITNTTLNFTCDAPEDLENDQTINSAITVRVRSRNNNCTISAKLSTFLGPSGFTTTTYPIQIDYTSTNSTRAYNINTNPISLTTTNQTLFNQYTSNSVFNYYYNLILKAPGYTYPLGQYNYVILFTMTQP
ncbi:hypothetical protein CAP35_10905 [Chitinophagaceae bacterium IBVUCB1]|nr:hypothetical protein CAP35_10905 [Chitinophagaceae bacterium IBVUCB1]